MKACWLKASVFATLVFLPSLVYAETTEADGNALLRNCQTMVDLHDSRDDVNRHDAGACLGTLTGVISLFATINKGLDPADQSCVPDSVTYIQAARIVVRWLKENPKYLNSGPGSLVFIAMRDAYPCK